MSLLVEFDEEMLEPIIAVYLRDALNRIEGYGDDCFDGMDEKWKSTVGDKHSPGGEKKIFNPLHPKLRAYFWLVL
mgnify:CR=1 FL=1